MSRGMLHFMIRVAAEKRLGHAMRNSCRITLIVGLTIAASAASAYAQSRQYFQRVTTTAENETRSLVRERSARPSSRDRRAPSTVSRLGSKGVARGASLTRAGSRSDALHPYTSGAGSQPQDRESDGSSRYSTSRSQPEPAAPASRATIPPRSHDYFPSLRSGVYVTQPVRLTAERTCPAGGYCVGGPSQAAGGVGQQSSSGTGHHR